ncbi:MAG: hypothetical protein KDA17_00620 [Candidatus Saccharibacteria bacterium]|nr:hypothetical protein [Candidatus Saccharibacteria bacterium]
MKPTYNHQLIAEALNKHTREKFEYRDESETFVSKNYEVTEIEMFIFEVSALTYDRDTGATNEFLIDTGLTLADAIDAIRKDKGEL